MFWALNRKITNFLTASSRPKGHIPTRNRTGIEVSHHELRRSGARQLYISLEPTVKDPLYRIKELLGHDDMSTTAKYIGLDEMMMTETGDIFYNHLYGGVKN